jgi:hypothetical protein
MITLNAIEARLKRQKIRELSGESFLEKKSIVSKIPFLETYDDQQILFGIYESEGTWTVLSVGSLYASYDYSTVVLKLETEGDRVHDYLGKEGNNFKSDVELDDGKRIWMKSVGVSCAIQNIILMLQEIPYGTTLKK